MTAPKTPSSWQAFHAHAPQPLPPHALTPPDVVALRAGGKGSGVPPPLAQGVVYRVRDDAIVVALDDPPEDDRELVLRIDRLGNEVWAAVFLPFFAYRTLFSTR